MKTGQTEKYQKIYLKGAACILFVAGIAKVFSLNQHLPILYRTNSIFFVLTNFQLLSLVAVLEMTVATSILFLHNFQVETKLLLVAWLATLFSIYRIGLVLADEPQPCKCLGNLLGWIGLPDNFVNFLSFVMLLYLLVPSVLWICLKRKN
jgi:hypothetical protein